MKNKILLLLMVLGFVGVGSANYWSSNTESINGIPDSGQFTIEEYSHFNYNDNDYLMIGLTNGNINIYDWNSTTWNRNTSFECGFYDMGSYAHPTVFNYSGILKTYITNTVGAEKQVGFIYNGTCWNKDNNVYNGISIIDTLQDIIVYNNRYIMMLHTQISGTDNYIYFYEYNGTYWNRNTTLENGLIDEEDGARLTMFLDNQSILRFLWGNNHDDTFDSYKWLDTSWILDNYYSSGVTKDGSSKGIEIFYFNNNQNNLYLLMDIGGDTVLSGYGADNKLYIDFNLSGNVDFIDVDNSSNDLENVFIEIENTAFNTYTDSNGNYAINNIPYGSYSLLYNKSLGFEYGSISISSSRYDLVENFNIRFSKPYISNPYNEGNFIKGVYVHNFKSLNLWENPNFVWGNYTYNNASYIKNCEYSGSNIFSCDIINDKSYSFKFVYSDVYNYDLDSYHPTLTGQRTFETSNINFFNGVVDNDTGEIVTSQPNKISDSAQEDRETLTFNNLLTALFLLFIFIVVIFIKSFGDKRK